MPTVQPLSVGHLKRYGETFIERLQEMYMLSVCAGRKKHVDSYVMV